MAEMGDGYGSECHLLRYLGRHRSLFNQEVDSAISGQDLEWLDYPFDPTRTWRDGEWKGLDSCQRTTQPVLLGPSLAPTRQSA